MTAAQLQIASTALKETQAKQPAKPGQPAKRRKLPPRLPKALQQELAKKGQRDL